MTGPCLCGDPYCRRCFPSYQDVEVFDYEGPEPDDEEEDPSRSDRERAEDDVDSRQD
jgi:hypothetical protein